MSFPFYHCTLIRSQPVGVTIRKCQRNSQVKLENDVLNLKHKDSDILCQIGFDGQYKKRYLTRILQNHWDRETASRLGFGGTQD